VAKIFTKFDPDNLEVIVNEPASVNKAEIARMLFELEDTIVYDDFAALPEMGRFVVEKDNVTVAGGIAKRN
jgi:translation elongation factor EF-1alpha